MDHAEVHSDIRRNYFAAYRYRFSLTHDGTSADEPIAPLVGLNARMEELIARHRKEQRDVQGRITQKKKSATKKTRKGVNDECDELERGLKQKHAEEIAALNGSSTSSVQLEPELDGSQRLDGESNHDTYAQPTLEDATQNLAIGRDDELNRTSQSTLHRKPNRQKARLARRAAEQEAAAAVAAEEAANIPDLKKKERDTMLEHFAQRNLKEKEVAANGHCLYSAVADQLRQLNMDLRPPSVLDTTESELGTKETDYRIVRAAAASYISSHSDTFLPFLEEPLPDYLRKIRDTGEWGGQLELQALSKTYGVDINVLQADGRVETMESGSGDSPKAWLAYYRHGFGLGEHYNSLRKADG